MHECPELYIPHRAKWNLIAGNSRWDCSLKSHSFQWENQTCAWLFPLELKVFASCGGSNSTWFSFLHSFAFLFQCSAWKGPMSSCTTSGLRWAAKIDLHSAWWPKEVNTSFFSDQWVWFKQDIQCVKRNTVTTVHSTLSSDLFKRCLISAL